MSKTSRQIDDAASGLAKIPLLNKLELDKILLFIKLFIVAPAVALNMAIAGGLGYRYYIERDERLLILMIYSFLFFTVSLISNAVITYNIRKIDIYNEEKIAKLTILKDMMYSEENLRIQWHTGWRKISLSKNARLNNLFTIIMDFPFKDINEKMKMLDFINKEFDIVRLEYEKLFMNIKNPLEEFAITHSKFPPSPDTTNIDRIEEILKKLRTFD